MDKTKQQKLADKIEIAKTDLLALLVTFPGYEEMCECDEQVIANTFHGYGDEYEICLNCGGMINMC